MVSACDFRASLSASHCPTAGPVAMEREEGAESAATDATALAPADKALMALGAAGTLVTRGELALASGQFAAACAGVTACAARSTATTSGPSVVDICMALSCCCRDCRPSTLLGSAGLSLTVVLEGSRDIDDDLRWSSAETASSSSLEMSMTAGGGFFICRTADRTGGDRISNWTGVSRESWSVPRGATEVGRGPSRSREMLLVCMGGDTGVCIRTMLAADWISIGSCERDTVREQDGGNSVGLGRRTAGLVSLGKSVNGARACVSTAGFRDVIATSAATAGMILSSAMTEGIDVVVAGTAVLLASRTDMLSASIDMLTTLSVLGLRDGCLDRLRLLGRDSAVGWDDNARLGPLSACWAMLTSGSFSTLAISSVAM